MSTADDENALSWLNRALWPDGNSRIVPIGDDDLAGPDRAESITAHWWAVPSPAHPHTLLPVDHPSTLARASRRYHDGQSLKRRGRSALAEVAARLPQPVRDAMLRGRVGLAGSLDDGVTGRLRHLLAEPELTIAVTLASPKSNRKPILQLLVPDGRCVGFAKVAVDDWTSGLIETEAAWLQRRPAPPLAMPELLWDGDIAGRRVLVQTSVLPPRLPRRRSTEPPPAAVFAAVQALGTSRTAPVRESAWWASVEAELDDAQPDEVALVEAAVDRAPGRMRLGAWHGDFAAWNLFTVGGLTAAIDWEFAADDVPVGFDALHFLLQSANETLGLDAGDALTWTHDRMTPLLDDLALPQSSHEPLWNCYLVELMRRRLRLRRHGLSVESVTHGQAAATWLTRIGAAS